MTKENQAIEKEEEKQMIKTNNKISIREVISTYDMISTVLSSGNILNVINDSVKDIDIRNRLFSAVGTFISDAVSFKVTTDDIDKYRDIIESYYETYLDYNDSDIVNNYFSLITQDLLHKVIQLKYISDGTDRKEVPLNNASSEKKNLVFTFYGDNFNSLIPNQQDYVIDYASTFWQMTMLIALSNLLSSIVPINTPELNLEAFNNFIALNIVTGVRMMVEFETDVDYGEYFEELCQLVPKNNKQLTIKPNSTKETITITVKDNSILTRAFKEEGYNKSNKIKYDPVLDKKSQGEIRIMQGSTPNSIKIITYITGMRTLSRLLSFDANPEQNILLSNFAIHYTGFFVSKIISFYLRATLFHCKTKSDGKSIIKSNYTVYSNFISEYKERTNSSRNIALNSLVPILLSKQPKEKQEELINKYFSKNDTRQKASIRADLIILNPVIENANKEECVLSELYWTLRRYYGW